MEISHRALMREPVDYGSESKMKVWSSQIDENILFSNVRQGMLHGETLPKQQQKTKQEWKTLEGMALNW